MKNKYKITCQYICVCANLPFYIIVKLAFANRHWQSHICWWKVKFYFTHAALFLQLVCVTRAFLFRISHNQYCTTLVCWVSEQSYRLEPSFTADDVPCIGSRLRVLLFLSSDFCPVGRKIVHIFTYWNILGGTRALLSHLWRSTHFCRLRHQPCNSLQAIRKEISFRFLAFLTLTVERRHATTVEQVFNEYPHPCWFLRQTEFNTIFNNQLSSQFLH